MKLNETISLHGTGETWLNHPPGLVTDTHSCTGHGSGVGL